MTDVQQQPKSNTQRAVDELRRLIFGGELAAGSNHLESELAELLDMSRTPVREATLVLSGQGLLEVRPRKGVRILPLSAEDMSEIYEILTELEGLAAERAAAAGYAEAELAVLSHAIEAMDQALADGDREAWAKADDCFHGELVRLGGNSRVQSYVALLGDQVRRARAVTLYMRPVPEESNAAHRAVLDAIRAGDTTGARAVHQQHRRQAGVLITELLKRHRLHQI